MTDPRYFPEALLKVTINGESEFFVTCGDDNDNGELSWLGQDILELAQELEAGNVGKQTVNAVRDWIWGSGNRQVRLNHIDWDVAPKDFEKRVNVDRWANHYYHVHVTKKGTMIVGYNESETKHIRYKLASFKRIVNEAK